MRRMRTLTILGVFFVLGTAEARDAKDLIREAFVKGFIGDNPWGGLGTFPGDVGLGLVDPFPPMPGDKLSESSPFPELPGEKQTKNISTYSGAKNQSGGGLFPPFDPVPPPKITQPFPPGGGSGKPAPIPPPMFPPGDPFLPAPGDPTLEDPTSKLYDRSVKFLDSVPGTKGYNFELGLDYDGRLTIELQVSKASLKDPYKVAEIVSYVQSMRNSFGPNSYGNYGAWFEILRNAAVGDPVSKAFKAKTLESALATLVDTGNTQIPKEVIKVFPGLRWKNAEVIKRRDRARLEWIELERLRLDHVQKTTMQWSQKQERLIELDRQTPRIKEMIANNDRKGVARLLERYMPWPLMTPTEVVIWQKWIEAIRNPAPPSRRRLIHRGIGGGERLYEGPAGRYLMSNFLRFTRGNYNERLRALSEIRLAKGKNFGEQSTAKPVTIAQMMVNHAGSANSSPLISSSVAKVAATFTEQGVNPGVVSMLIDDRRILKNSFAAGFGHEVERLIPLMVFPDEVIAFQKAEFKKVKPPPGFGVPGQGTPGQGDPFFPVDPPLNEPLLPTDPKPEGPKQQFLPGFEGVNKPGSGASNPSVIGDSFIDPGFGSASTVDLDQLNAKTQARLQELGIDKYLNSEDAKEWASRLMVDYLKKTAKDCNALMIEYHLAMKKYQ